MKVLLSSLRNVVMALMCAFRGHRLETREGGDYCTRCQRLVTRMPK